MAINPNGIAVEANFDVGSAMDKMMSPPSSQPEVEQSTNQESHVEQTRQEAPQSSGEATQSNAAEELVEFEGKQYKLDKSAKDYMIEMLKRDKGMRKAFSERDSEKKKWSEREQDLVRYEQITSTFKSKGIEGLYDALAGNDGAYAKHLKSIEDKAIRKYNATADELKIIELEDARERAEMLRDLAEKSAKEKLDSIQRKENEANTTVIKNRIEEAFEAVRFEGKLGDEKREAKFNKYVWEQARLALNDYAKEKGVEPHKIPSKVVKELFAEAAAELDSTIKTQVESKVKEQAQIGSDAATKAAQARSTAGVKKPANSIEALADKHSDNIAKGGITAFINEVLGRR